MNQIALLHDKIKTLEQLLDVQEQTVIDQIGKLAESENSFREMFEITSEGVALISSQTGKFIAANPAACRLLDYSEEEFLELHPEDITPAAAKEIMRKTLRTIAEGGMVPDHEGLCVRKDGTNVNVIVSNRHMSWKGEPVFFVGFKDVTFLKMIQAQLKKKNDEIMEFTTMVTHDLKKPLTTMKITFDLAKTGAFGVLNPNGIESMNMGLEASRYMQEMLEDLLVSARLEAGANILNREKVLCSVLVQHVVDKLKYQIQEKNIVVATKGLEIEVNADPKGLTKIFMNLIGNAVSYIGTKKNRRLSISAEKRNGHVVFTVADNGIGIPRESHPTLFQKFHRGSNVSGISGTGLGLSIVRATVLAHDGRIWFESTEGQGTAFHFTLSNDVATG